MSTDKQNEAAPALSCGGLVRRVAYAIALAYVGGWRQHAKLIGEPEGMPAEKWADANWEMFLQEAEIATAGNDSEPNAASETRGGDAPSA